MHVTLRNTSWFAVVAQAVSFDGAPATYSQEYGEFMALATAAWDFLACCSHQQLQQCLTVFSGDYFLLRILYIRRLELHLTNISITGIGGAQQMAITIVPQR